MVEKRKTRRYPLSVMIYFLSYLYASRSYGRGLHGHGLHGHVRHVSEQGEKRLMVYGVRKGIDVEKY